MTAPAICYCEHPFEAHRDGATTCALCTTCPGYVEHAAVAAYRDQLDVEDQWNGRLHDDNEAAAIELARRQRGAA